MELSPSDMIWTQVLLMCASSSSSAEMEVGEASSAKIRSSESGLDGGLGRGQVEDRDPRGFIRLKDILEEEEEDPLFSSSADKLFFVESSGECGERERERERV